MDKKQITLWSLYDFANSIVFINFILYFGQWITINGGLSDFGYNALFAITTILLLFTAPSLAALTDKFGGRKFFLNISTVGTFVSYGLAACFAHWNIANVYWIAFLFLLGQYFYQLAFIFYNPLIDQISDKEHRGRVSGIGIFSNALGQVVGLLITLPLSHSRTLPLLPAVIVSFAFCLPMMIYFKEKMIRQKPSFTQVKVETRAYVKRMIAFFAASVVTPMLVAFFFFNDALVTLSNNYPIYMERVFGVSDTTKSILLMAVLVMSGVGGLAAGWIGDRIGNMRTLKYILVGWIIALPLIAIAPNIPSFTVITVAVGLLLGSVWTVTRAYLSNTLPKDQMGYGFSFYTLAERFATLIGPLAWGATIWILGTEGFAYRVGMIVMAVFVVIGLIILNVWKREPSDVKVDIAI